MAEKTLQDLLNKELESQYESAIDIVEVRVSNTGIVPAGEKHSSGHRIVSYEDLAEYTGDAGFGSQSFPNLYAWTKKRVYFKHVYDGAESVCSVPRNPCDEIPKVI